MGHRDGRARGRIDRDGIWQLLHVVQTQAETDVWCNRLSSRDRSGIAARLRRFGMRIDEHGAAGSSADSMTTIESPFSGVVISAEAAPGEVINTEKQLFAIADLS